MEDRWLNIPNLISFARLGLVPVFLYLQVTGNAKWALICFVVAMSSDALDGFLARVLNQRSRLGGILDPVADKLLVATALVTLMVDRRIPWWLLAPILVRDGLMLAGAVVVKHKHLELPIAPSRIGKYATFGLACLVVLALIWPVRPSAELTAYTAVTGYLAGLCVVLSTVQYLARFGYLFFAPARRQPSESDGKRVRA